MNKQQRNEVLTVLKKIQTAIDMFEQYKSTPYNDGVLETLRESKTEVLAYSRGEIDKEKMSYHSLYWFYTMPSWGYAGT